MENPVKLLPTAIEGLFVAETNLLTDHRGSFSRLFCEQELALAIGNRQIVQVNQSKTKTPGVIRGMHFQYPPHAEMKLIRCLKGRVWDVTVDLRAGSQTFLQWHAEELSSENARMMIVPEGFAHGFQVLDPDSEMLYLHTAFYTPEKSSGVAFDDPRLAIAWPLTIPDLSGNDKRHPPMSPDFSGIKI